jgi:hypothetical protein
MVRNRTMFSVVQWLVFLSLDRRFLDSNLVKAMDFKGNKSPQHTFLRRGVKPEAPYRKILWHVKNHL